jgi:ParB-like chromosome segregation protein Spo0J
MRLSAINNPLGRIIHTIPVNKLRNSYPGKIVVISEVKRSIKEHGMLNPLFVVPSEDGIYQVYVGNNRFIAGKKLGFTEFDCYIAEPGDNFKEMDRFFKMKPIDFP